MLRDARRNYCRSLLDELDYATVWTFMKNFTEERFTALRDAMVRDQLAARGISDINVLAAMTKVPRHRFVPAHLLHEAYSDRALLIGVDQTISQPYVVALMLQELGVGRYQRVLEIGTGSGYQTALLAEMAQHVWSLEVDPKLCEMSQALLRDFSYTNVEIRHGNGFAGWPEHAPFDAIIVTAAPSSLPRALVHQLTMGGTLILPVGEDEQCLLKIRKTEAGLVSTDLGTVRFVRMLPESDKSWYC